MTRLIVDDPLDALPPDQTDALRRAVAEPLPGDGDIARVWAKTQQALGDQRLDARRHVHMQTPQTRHWRWGISAVSVVMVILSVIIPRVHPTLSTRMYHTQLGQRGSIVLPDGTRIMLASQSSIALTPGNWHASRNVTLSGEAYFDVQNTTRSPFTVYTGKISTRVLGTTFTVHRYPGEDTTQVLVTSGRVVTGNQRRIIASAGTAVRATDSSAVTTSPAELHSYTDWNTGQLVCEQMPVSQLLTTLGRWYGYQFKLADSTLAVGHVSAVFDANNADEMFTMIKKVLDVSMTFDGNVVTLHAMHGQTPRRHIDRRTVLQATDVLTPALEKGR